MKVKHYAVSHAFIEFVGVDKGSEHHDAFLFVVFQQRRTRKANQNGVGHKRLDRFVQFSGVGAVAFVDKADNIPLGLKVLRQMIQQFLAVLLNIGVFPGVMPVLVNERANNIGLGGIEKRPEVGATFRPPRLW